MIKKITACVFFLIFTLSVSTYIFAEPADDISAATPTPQTEQNVPSQGSRGGRPQGDFGGQPPQMPNGNFGGGQMPQESRNIDNATAPQAPEKQVNGQGQVSSTHNPSLNTTEQTSGQTEELQADTPSESTQPSFGDENLRIPGESFGNPNTRSQTQPTFMSFIKEYTTSIISLILLLLAFIFVKFYKRKNY